MVMKVKQEVEVYQQEEVENHELLRELFDWPEVNKSQSLKAVKLFSHGKREVTEEGIVKVIKKIEKRSTSSDLDVTGSPLKASFNLDEEDENDFDIVTVARKPSGPSYLPIITTDARQYLSGLNSLEDNFPTFFVCNNEDSTLFLGKSKLENEHKTYKVEDRGIASSSIQLGDLIEEHKKLQPTSKFQIGARSVYNVSDPMGANVNEDFSSVKLRFSWNNPVTLCEAPPGFANAEIHAQVSFFDDRLSSFKLHQDIQLLNGLLQGLNNQGIKWFANDEEDFDLFDSLKNLMLDVKQIGPKGLKTKAEVVTGDDSLDEVVAILERQDLDFIDLLWDVLKKVNSLAELKSAWEAIFECLKRDEIKPFVHARNSTKVAKMVKAIIREVTIDPADYLEGSLPLELLYEMGVEKLKNDYMFAILHNLLATREELEKILVEKDTILMLEKLHTIHTLLCLCQTFLSPTQACLETVVRQSIKALSTWEKVSEKPQFTFTVPCSQLKEQISKLCPNIWQCHMNSPGDKLTIGTTFNLSIDPVSDLIDIKEAKIDEENEEEDSERKVHYYMLKAAAINRRL